MWHSGAAREILIGSVLEHVLPVMCVGG